MKLRGFGKEKKKRTWYMQRPFKRNDWTAVALCVLLLTTSVVITFWDGNRFYHPLISIRNPSFARAAKLGFAFSFACCIR